MRAFSKCIIVTSLLTLTLLAIGCSDDEPEPAESSEDGSDGSDDGENGTGGRGEDDNGTGGSEDDDDGTGGDDDTCDLSMDGISDLDHEEIPTAIDSDMTLTSDKVWELNDKVHVEDGATLTIEPVPMSNMNLSPLPSSTSQQVAAWSRRAAGMPVPQANSRISSAASSSVPG